MVVILFVDVCLSYRIEMSSMWQTKNRQKHNDHEQKYVLCKKYIKCIMEKRVLCKIYIKSIMEKRVLCKKYIKCMFQQWFYVIST